VKDLKIIALRGLSDFNKENGTGFNGSSHLWVTVDASNASGVFAYPRSSNPPLLIETCFTLIDFPIFTPSACEGTTNLF